MIPVIHKKCGGQIGWYLSDTCTYGEPAIAKKYMRLDGSVPLCNSAVNEICPKCGESIRALHKLERKITGKI